MNQIQKHNQLLEHHWWHDGLRDLVLNTLGEPDGRVILDAGCGVGVLMDAIEWYGGDSIYGIDISQEAIDYCIKRGLKKVSTASVQYIPYARNYFDTVICLDVLYHVGVRDESKAMMEFNRVLRKGGRLILHLPAYEWLRSGHDVIACTRHRYTKGEVENLMKISGFNVIKSTYRNTILFPFIALARILGKYLEPKSDLSETPRLLNSILKRVLYHENILLEEHDFAFGLSVFCVGVKE